MGDFKDSTKTVAGHHHVPASQFHTFGNQSLPPAAPTRPTAHKEFRDLTEREPSHNFSGSAAVRRQVPTTELEGEHGGKSDLLPGYNKGGRHFHVHKHYYTGGKVTHSESKHYASGGHVGGATRKMNMQESTEFQGNPGRRGGFNKGGSCEGETGTGSTRNKMAKGGKWIQGAIKHPGALHRSLGVPEGKKIPAGKLAKAAHSSNPTLRRRANLAKTLKGMHKAKGGPVMKAAKGGHIHDCTSPVPPNYATGGTINKLGAGGALYNKGGESKHEKSAEHHGFRSELSTLRHRLKD